VTCPSCGTVLPPEAVYCLKCGTKQSSVGTGPLELSVSLGEIPYAVVLKDIWLFAMVGSAVTEIKASARPTDSRGNFGGWLSGSLVNPRPGVLEPLVKLGDIVRWQFDFVETNLLLRTPGGELTAMTTIPIASRDLRRLPLAAATGAQPP